MKSNNAVAYLSTTGTGIAIGTGIALVGIIRGSDVAGTVNIVASAGALFTMSADRSITFSHPIAIAGPVTMTSSAGDHFVVLYRKMG